MSGFASMNGFADREPVLPPMYLADSVAGLSGAAAAMIALREAESKGGSGQVIDLPLLEPLFNILGPQAANLRLTGKAKARTGNRSTTTAPRNAYRAKDGRWVCLSASIQKMAERLFRARHGSGPQAPRDAAPFAHARRDPRASTEAGRAQPRPARRNRGRRGRLCQAARLRRRVRRPSGIQRRRRMKPGLPVWRSLL